MPNHTFSISKNRGLTSFEARVGSIRRRIQDPLGRRNSVGGRGLPTIIQEHSLEMPPRERRRQRGVNWDADASGTEESYVNGPGSSSTNHRVSAVDEFGKDSGNDHATDQVNGARPRQSNTSRNSRQSSLGPWTQAVRDVVQNMGATSRAMNSLESKFKSHMDELVGMDETSDMLARLEGECSEKDNQIKALESTITTLISMDSKAKVDIDQRVAEIEKMKKQLGEEGSKQDKRATAEIAQDRLKLKTEFEKLTKEHDKSYAGRRKELEDEGIRIKEEKKELVATVEKLNKSLETQSEKLDGALEECDSFKRATNSLRKEKQHLEKELQVTKEEFALDSKPMKYFEQAFKDIYCSIEGISLKYFHDIDKKDLESTHDELAAADPYFRSVPIDDTDDSHDLRAAHAQRIISHALCEYIWKPLRSEFTLLHPEFNDLLSKLSDSLQISNRGGRVANVWTALTMRALESLLVDPKMAQVTESQDTTQVVGSFRADKVISKVISVLSPLISPPELGGLRRDLEKLAKSAIDVWVSAQSGELEITVDHLLGHEHRDEWRSQRFDPAPSSPDRSEADFDVISKTRPRIIVLFPRVVAWVEADLAKDENSLPGSFPSELGQAPHTVATCIYPGRGLPEWSSLVVRGKEEREEQKEFLLKAIKNAKKEAHSNRRMMDHSRRESINSTLGPPT